MEISTNRSYIISRICLGIIGAGNIATEHIKVIQSIKTVNIKGITSRTISKAERLKETFAIEKVYDNIDHLIAKCPLDAILILVSTDQIFNIAKKLIPTQIPLFIEKPPGINPEETELLVNLAKKYNTINMVGYNRRYYSIFHKGIKKINDNGKLLGLSIEGHERFWNLKEKGIPKKITDNWIYANSTHTIDLLRFFGGEISDINSFKKSYKEKNGDQFVATIKFSSGALGTYRSHWHSPGGWSVTLYGDEITVKFNPLEKGIYIDTELKTNEILQNKNDINFKPGFRSQMEAFINMLETKKLAWPAVDLSAALKTMYLAKKINE